jgi:hypothetical protein
LAVLVRRRLPDCAGAAAFVAVVGLLREFILFACPPWL